MWILEVESDVLFNLYEEYLMNESFTEFSDYQFGGGIINNVRFADDTAKTLEEQQHMVDRLVDIGRKYGMEINIDES